MVMQTVPAAQDTTSDRLQRVVEAIEWSEGVGSPGEYDHDPTVTPARGRAVVGEAHTEYRQMCERSHRHCRGCLGHTRREQSWGKWWRILFGTLILWVVQWYGGMRLDPLLFLWCFAGTWLALTFLMEGYRRDTS